MTRPFRHLGTILAVVSQQHIHSRSVQSHLPHKGIKVESPWQSSYKEAMRREDLPSSQLPYPEPCSSSTLNSLSTSGLGNLLVGQNCLNPVYLHCDLVPLSAFYLLHCWCHLYLLLTLFVGSFFHHEAYMRIILIYIVTTEHLRQDTLKAKR